MVHYYVDKYGRIWRWNVKNSLITLLNLKEPHFMVDNQVICDAATFNSFKKIWDFKYIDSPSKVEMLINLNRTRE
jgi:hypothetical protein